MIRQLMVICVICSVLVSLKNATTRYESPPMCSTFGSTDPKEDDENNNPKSADLKEVVNKLIPNSIGKDIEKTCQSICPLHDAFTRKVKSADEMQI